MCILVSGSAAGQGKAAQADDIDAECGGPYPGDVRLWELDWRAAPLEQCLDISKILDSLRRDRHGEARTRVILLQGATG